MAKRGLSSSDARLVRKRGHDDAKEFALLIGLEHDYQNDPTAKKDVIDPSGDTHSLKSGEKKWQLFLYGINRFKEDDFFQAMNGVGQLIIQCLESFPEKYEDYVQDKNAAKERCRIPMRQLAASLQKKHLVRALINKAIFNAGEVNYLTVKHENVYHVFLDKDVVQVFADAVEVCNSQAYSKNQMPEQKVIFKYNGLNLAELEMRNDTPVHYREVRFNMIKPRMMELLFSKIQLASKYSEKIRVYGNAAKKFGKWEKR